MAHLDAGIDEVWRRRLIASVQGSRPWCTKAFFAIVDQGLISGSNFALGILLARWLGPGEYGAYAFAFSVFILLSLVYQSLLLEPMSVFGPSLYRKRLHAYSGRLLWIHVVLALATFVVISGVAVSLRNVTRFQGLSSPLIGSAIAAPCVLLFWLARRIYYLRFASSQAATGALIYCGLVFAILSMLYHARHVTPMTAFITMAVAALMASTYLLLRFRSITEKGSSPDLRQVVRENWIYGRWALAAAIAMWVPWNVFYTVLGSFHGMAEAGQLRALLNFSLPMTQTYAAFSLLFLPHAASLNQDHGWDAVRRNSYRITSLFAAGGVAYWSIVCVLRNQLIAVLYAGNYHAIAPFLPWVAAASICWGAAQGPALALRGSRSPSSVFVMYSMSAAIALAFGIPAALRFGIAGAIGAIFLASAAAWLIGFVGIARHSKAEFRQAI